MTPEKLLHRVRKTHGEVLNLALVTYWFEKYGAERLEEVIDQLPPPGRCHHPESWMRRALEQEWVFRKRRRRTIRIGAPKNREDYKAHIARMVLGPNATASDYDQIASSLPNKEPR